MEAKLTEIILGEAVCEKLKAIYHPNETWIACHVSVSRKFSELKKIMRKFYSDKNEHEMLIELNKYNKEDIEECLS